MLDTTGAALSLPPSPIDWTDAALTLRRQTRFIVVHVTAMTGGVLDVDRVHREESWLGIGYHVHIRTDGTIESGRPLDAVGAGVSGYNSFSAHVALEGGVDGDGQPDGSTITAAQFEALERVAWLLVARYPGAVLLGHRDLSPDLDGDDEIDAGEWVKACPCFDAIPWAAERGLPAAPVGKAWTADDARRPAAPDARTAYLQRLLGKAGYDVGVADGIVGERTRAAIERFQRAEDLPPTAAFDPVTVARLRARVETPAPATRPKIAPTLPTDGGQRWGAALLAALASFGGWVAALPLWLSIPAVAAAVMIGAWMIRAARRQTQVAEALARGEVLPEPAPDWLDWLASWASAMFTRTRGGAGPVETPS